MKILILPIIFSLMAGVICGCLMPKGERLGSLYYVNDKGEVKHIVIREPMVIIGEIND